MKIKIILVGNAGVGKTAIINRFIEGSFEGNYNPSISLSYVSKKFSNNSGEEVQLNIWDTAGQEQYKSISNIYFRDCDVAVVCFNYDDQKSMDDIDDWVGRINNSVSNCILYLVSTKDDLIDKIDEVENFMKNKKGDTFAKTFRSSAKNGFGIQEIFMDAINEDFGYHETSTSLMINSSDSKNSSFECC